MLTLLNHRKALRFQKEVFLSMRRRHFRVTLNDIRGFCSPSLQDSFTAPEICFRLVTPFEAPAVIYVWLVAASLPHLDTCYSQLTIVLFIHFHGQFLPSQSFFLFDDVDGHGN